MGPSNFRYDPYNDIPTGVEITERHVIPSNSPYYIRLNEVPQKTSPSTLSVKEITDIGTSVTYGQTFNEVAATPAAGEFWPDCNTGANGNESWNTGLIAFNATDAGKIIEVTYTGIGTLAGITSNHYPPWWTDRGDGSDGDFVPAGNVTISGIKNYKSVYIKAGVTVTVDKYALIKCQGVFINRGTINVTQVPNAGYTPSIYANSATVGIGGISCPISPNIISSGGASYSDGEFPITPGVAPIISQSNLQSIIYYPLQIYCGGGGSAWYQTESDSGTSARELGGNGGGSITIVCKSFENNVIKALGESTERFIGAGGGGLIMVVADQIIKQGTGTVTGGKSTTDGYGGGSGGNGLFLTKELGV